MQKSQDEVKPQLKQVLSKQEQAHYFKKLEPTEQRILTEGCDNSAQSQYFGVKLKLPAQLSARYLHLILDIALEIAILSLNRDEIKPFIKSEKQLLLLEILNLKLPKQSVCRDQVSIHVPLKVLNRHEVLSHPLHEIIVKKFEPDTIRFLVRLIKVF